jgi:hypothetical protein
MLRIALIASAAGALACLGAVPFCLVKPRFAMFRASQMFAPSRMFEQKV